MEILDELLKGPDSASQSGTNTNLRSVGAGRRNRITKDQPLTSKCRDLSCSLLHEDQSFHLHSVEQSALTCQLFYQS